MNLDRQKLLDILIESTDFKRTISHNDLYARMVLTGIINKFNELCGVQFTENFISEVKGNYLMERLSSVIDNEGNIINEEDKAKVIERADKVRYEIFKYIMKNTDESQELKDIDEQKIYNLVSELFSTLYYKNAFEVNYQRRLDILYAYFGVENNLDVTPYLNMLSQNAENETIRKNIINQFNLLVVYDIRNKLYKKLSKGNEEKPNRQKLLDILIESTDFKRTISHNNLYARMVLTGIMNKFNELCGRSFAVDFCYESEKGFLPMRLSSVIDNEGNIINEEDKAKVIERADEVRYEIFKYIMENTDESQELKDINEQKIYNLVSELFSTLYYKNAFEVNYQRRLDILYAYFGVENNLDVTPYLNMLSQNAENETIRKNIINQFCIEVVNNINYSLNMKKTNVL